MKKILIFVLFGLLIFGFIPRIDAETGVRYPTFTTSDGRLVRTQTAYVPTVSLTSIKGIQIGEPTDIHITPNNVLYMTAILNNRSRVIIYDLNDGSVREVGGDFLVNATGVFANEAGIIYVADRGNKIAYQLSSRGEILETYTRPNSPLFGSEDFQPRKIIADARGNVYILNLGIRGLAQFSNSGEFLGYFGANTITPTLRTILQFTFFTEEQRARLFNLQPPEVSNMAIDQRGLIHTVSLGVENFGVKRLNISGGNLLPAMFNAQDLVDVFVGPIGNIYVLTRTGRIYEYDREGNLLFLFGDQDVSNQISGLFNAPVGMAVDRAFNLYVIDRAAKELTIFNPTEFASNVHGALTLYQDGNYIDSLGPWQDVLRMNDFFDLAHRGFGNAYFSLANYEGALEEYRIANDRLGYSEAFWEVRNAWLLEFGAFFVGLLFTLLIVLTVNIKLKFMRHLTQPIKKGLVFIRSKVKVIDDILYVFKYLRNPADASYEIKRKDRIQILSVTVLLFIFFGFYIYHIYETSFLFNNRRLEEINLLEEMARILLPIMLWVISNFLIGSIREGEGRLKDVYITTIFSLSPYFLTLPILTILSQGLTFNELFIYQFIQFIAVLVTVVYFFFMVKETHFYTVKETVQSISISGFTMVMLLLGVFIVFILFNEIITLGRDVSLEVYYRVFDR
jgi:sugar lactone lactonase YvrE